MSCRNFMLTKIYRLRAGESMKPSSMSFSPVRACGPIGTQCSCGQQALLTLRSIMAFGSASTVRLTNFLIRRLFLYSQPACRRKQSHDERSGLRGGQPYLLDTSGAELRRREPQRACYCTAPYLDSDTRRAHSGSLSRSCPQQHPCARCRHWAGILCGHSQCVGVCGDRRRLHRCNAQ